MGRFSDSFQQVVDTDVDLSRHFLVGSGELQPEHKQLRQLRHLV